MSTSTSTNTKANKKNLTSYWGIEFTDNTDTQLMAAAATTLVSLPNLVPLKKCHSTLLFVGKKVNPDEAVFADFEGLPCIVIVDAFGFTQDALAFRVKEISTVESPPRNVPSFAAKQHITYALRAGVAAKDSVKTLLGDGTVVELDSELILTGKVKRFLY